MGVMYKASTWLAPNALIFSHARNRSLNAETHSHDFYEVVYLFSGCVTHRVDRFIHDMLPGEINILRPGDTHLLLRKSENFELYSISIDAAEMDMFLNAYGLEKTIAQAPSSYAFSLGKSQYAIESLFKRLSRLTAEKRSGQLRIILGETMHELIYSQAGYGQNCLDSVFQKMNSKENLIEGVPAMQRLCNLSHSQLCRVVKKYTNMTPQQYIKELRLVHAYDLIQSTDLPFEDISNDVGYSSFSHFSTSFKNRFGLSPSALRKQYNSLL